MSLTLWLRLTVWRERWKVSGRIAACSPSPSRWPSSTLRSWCCRVDSINRTGTLTSDPHVSLVCSLIGQKSFRWCRLVFWLMCCTEGSLICSGFLQTDSTSFRHFLSTSSFVKVELILASGSRPRKQQPLFPGMRDFWHSNTKGAFWITYCFFLSFYV